MAGRPSKSKVNWALEFTGLESKIRNIWYVIVNQDVVLSEFKIEYRWLADQASRESNRF